ncbi:hypothetical protein K2P56_02475 [Patescibacteria group bacterium]|nr:hypothetical protein [Patescibacteria group bacterium]
MLRKSLLAFALLLAFSVAGVAYASHSWGNYHWARTSNPFTLKLGDNVTSVWDAYLAEASSDWSASSVLDTTIVAGLVSPRQCKGTTGRIEVCNAAYGNNGWLGIASIWADSNGHITKGTAKMNDSYFNTASYNAPAWRRLVMCQEVAHAFGLAHQDEAFNNANLGSCVDYTNDPDGGAGGASATDPANEHPNAHDFAQLELMYAHTDSSTTVGQLAGKALGAAHAALQAGNAEHPEFGVAIGRDAQGRANEFAKKDGDLTLITHVFWLPGEGEDHE